MNLLHDFLLDLGAKYSDEVSRGNESKPKQNIINPESKYYQSLVKTASNIPEDIYAIEKLTPGEITASGSVLINRNLTQAYINRPTSIRKHPVTGNIWVSSYHDRLFSMDANGDVVKVFAGKWTAENDGYAYVQDFCFSSDGSLLYMVTYRHELICFNMISGERVWSFGTNGSAGHLADGKLYNPISVDLINDSKLIVSSWNGNATVDGELSTRNEGHVSIFNTSDGSLDKTLTACLGSYYFMPERNGSRYIHCVRVINSKIYMAHYHDNMISIWDIDESGNITFKKRITRPDEAKSSSLYPISVTTDGAGNVLIASQGERAIGVVNEESNDLVAFFGKQEIDDRPEPKNNPYGFSSLRNIFFEDGFCYVCDNGNNKICKVKPATYQLVPMTSNIPSEDKKDMELIFSDGELYRESPESVLIRTSDAQYIKPITRVYKKKVF